MTSELSTKIVTGLPRPSVEPSQQIQRTQPRAEVAKTSASASASGPKAAERTNGEKLDSSVRNLNDFVQSVRRNLHFSIDSDSGRTVVKVIDADTDKVIRQIPSDEVLVMARRLEEQAGEPGLLFGEST
jgi:flagellar protein FlaG